MNYLSGVETTANGNVLWIVARYLQDCGESSLKALTQELRPLPLVSGGDHSLRGSLSVGAHIGILETDRNGTWRCTPGVADGLDLSDAHTFRSLIRSAMLARAVMDIDAGGSPADVPLGIAWLLTLDPSRPLPRTWGDRNGTEEVVRSSGHMRDVIGNQEQWRAFRRWAVFLGFATDSKPKRSFQTFVPDPTHAISDCLTAFPRSMTGQQFAARLATQLPVVDNGRVADALVDLDVRHEPRGDSTIGPAVGYALERLHRRGRISLLTTDDARSRVTYRWRNAINTFDAVEVMESS